MATIKKLAMDFDKDFVLQAGAPTRRSLVACERTFTALQLTTEPGDNNIAGSGDMERCDQMQCVRGTQAPFVHGEGATGWWAHSVMFPDTFAMPSWHAYVVFDFHHTGPLGQANYQLDFGPQGDITLPGRLRLRRSFDSPESPTTREVLLEPVRRNEWYDFIYHVRWTSKNDGFFRAELNGRVVMDHVGPTLYPGHGVYLKLANYHTPICDPYPSCIGRHTASSVIHDRVRCGPTRASLEAV